MYVGRTPLIADRGDVGCRIARAAKKMGLRPFRFTRKPMRAASREALRSEPIHGKRRGYGQLY
jgi:biotin carboxylase